MSIGYDYLKTQLPIRDQDTRDTAKEDYIFLKEDENSNVFMNEEISIDEEKQSAVISNNKTYDSNFKPECEFKESLTSGYTSKCVLSKTGVCSRHRETYSQLISDYSFAKK